MSSRRSLCASAIVVMSIHAASCTLVDLSKLQGGAGGDAASTASGATVTSSSAKTSSATLAASTGTGGAPSKYDAAVLADSPIAYYRFDDPAQASVAKDSVGAFDGQYTTSVIRGAAGALAGDASDSITLDGASAAVVLPNAFGFTPMKPFTVEVWAKPVSSGSFQFLFEKSSRNPRDGYTLLFYSNDAAAIERWTGGSATVANGTGTVTMNEWHHVVTTFDGSFLRIYVDGVPAMQTSDSLPLADNTLPAVIGGPSDLTSGFFKGGMDEVAIYDHPLTADRIAAHYAVGTGK